MYLPDDLKNYTAPRTFDLDAGIAYDLFWVALIVALFIL
jgi:hypothetical protein